MNLGIVLDQKKELYMAERDVIKELTIESEKALRYVASCEIWWTEAKNNITETVQFVDQIQRGPIRSATNKELNDKLLVLLKILSQFQSKVAFREVLYLIPHCLFHV